MGHRQSEHDRLVSRFIADAPYLIQNAQANLGTYDVEPPTICASSLFALKCAELHLLHGELKAERCLDLLDGRRLDVIGPQVRLSVLDQVRRVGNEAADQPVML